LFFPLAVLGAHQAPAIENFSQAKKFLNKKLELFESKTIYCSCTINAKKVDIKSCGYKVQSDPKRAVRMEWEHVVPAEAFGQSFAEWREGSEKCVKRGKRFKGRKCAETNAQFEKMESDLYNLFPEIGELNGLRSNYSMAQISGEAKRFGNCAAKLEDRKFEPADSAKGIVARTYFNFENRYPGHGIVSDKNRKLFEAWNKTYPTTALECKRWKALEKANGYPHLFLSSCTSL
jgi:deoxyribonuclease-1